MQGLDKIPPSFGGDAIMEKIRDGCRRPNLSTNRYQFRSDITRLLEEPIKFRKHPTNGLGGDAITRQTYGRMERRTDEWTPDDPPLS